MRDRNRIFISSLIILLFLSSFSPVEGEVRTIKFVDTMVGEQPLPKVLSSERGTEEPLSLTSGTDFSDAISIPMTKEGTLRRGTLEFQLNVTNPFIFFRYDINQTSPVAVTVNSATGTTVDENHYEIALDVYQGSGFEDWVGYKSTFEFDLPMTTDYPAEKTGDHFVSISAFDLVDFEFSPGEFVSLNVTILHYPAGAVRENEKTTSFESDPIRTILGVQNYLTTEGFINLDTSTVNLGELDVNDPNFAKVVGLSVYGLLKSAEVLVKTNGSDDSQAASSMVQYLDLAYEIFRIADQAMLEPVSGLFYFRPSESNPAGQDFVTYLADNAYLVMAMNEIRWYSSNLLPPATVSFDVLALQNKASTITDRMIAMFKQAQGDYRERLSITDYAEDGNPNVFDASDYAAISVSSLNSLESYSIVAETLYWAGQTTEMDDLVSYVGTNMNITNVNGKSILPTGILASTYDAVGGNPSDEVDLLSNSFFVSHLNTYAKENYPMSGLNTDPQGSLEVASNLMENILRVFSSDDPTSFLLYSTFNVTSQASSEKIVNNIDNVAAVFAMNRLAVNWEIYNPGLSGEAITRAWKIRSLNGMNALHNLLFDERNNFYFGYWDNQAKKLDVDNNNVEKNLFLANTFIEAVLIDMFPVEMTVIEQPDLPVGEEGQVTLGLNLLEAGGAWIWWDPFKPFTFDIKVTISDFNYVKTETVLLGSFSTTETLYVPFTYEITQRGPYDIVIELSTEGLVLLSQTVQSRALGTARPEFSVQSFSITDTTFETDLTLIDEVGDVLSSLQVSGALGLPFKDNIQQFNQKYIRSGRTDTSGKLELTFSTTDLSSDGLVNLTDLYQRDPIPPFTEIFLYLNITNSEAFDLESRVIVVPVRVILNRVNMRVSPSNLEITQGTTEAFTFSVTALDQLQNPIKDAAISYQILELPEIRNTVFTDLDGEASITIRDTDLFALSNLAILANQGRDTNDLETINVTVSMTLNSSLYPVRTINRPLTISPNSLVITANPVQLSVKEANIIQQSIPPIDVEVAVSDIFSKVVNAFVSIEWRDKSINNFVPLNPEEKHLSPYTFSVDVTKLPAGNYTLIIIAEKDGITSTVDVETLNPGLALAQVEKINRPVITARNIIIEASTTEDIAISLFSVLSALAIAKGASFLGSFSLQVIGINRKCPFCDEIISAKNEVCSHCGRDIPKKGEKPSPDAGSNPPAPPEPEDEPAKEL